MSCLDDAKLDAAYDAFLKVWDSGATRGEGYSMKVLRRDAMRAALDVASAWQRQSDPKPPVRKTFGKRPPYMSYEWRRIYGDEDLPDLDRIKDK